MRPHGCCASMYCRAMPVSRHVPGESGEVSPLAFSWLMPSCVVALSESPGDGPTTTSCRMESPNGRSVASPASGDQWRGRPMMAHVRSARANHASDILDGNSTITTSVKRHCVSVRRSSLTRHLAPRLDAVCRLSLNGALPCRQPRASATRIPFDTNDPHHSPTPALTRDTSIHSSRGRGPARARRDRSPGRRTAEMPSDDARGHHAPHV